MIRDYIIPQSGPIAIVVENGNNRLSLWNLCDGIVCRHVGGPGYLPGQFMSLQEVAFTSDKLLVVADESPRIQIFTLEGIVVRILTLTVGIGARFLQALDVSSELVANYSDIFTRHDAYGSRLLGGLAVSPVTNDIIITDRRNHCVMAVTWSTEVRINGCLIFFIILIVLTVHTIHTTVTGRLDRCSYMGHVW